MAQLTRAAAARSGRLLVLCGLVLAVATVAPARAQERPPELTAPVNDFANVIDPTSEAAIAALIRSLQQASGDVVVVATVPTFAPYATLEEYAVEMFENHGKGVGARGRDNGMLVVLAVDDREVRVEVGYDLEQFITDGFAGETSRQAMVPEFRRGRYGPGLLAGVSRLVARIAEGRNVTLQGVPRVRRRAAEPDLGGGLLVALFITIVVLQLLARAIGGGGRRFRRRGWGGYYGGWHSGVGPFGGGGFGGGGFGGGFGGFGGGRSGGGGGGASW